MISPQTSPSLSPAPLAIEVLECILSPARDRFVHVCACDSDSHVFLAANLPRERILPLRLSPSVGTMVNDLEILTALGGADPSFAPLSLIVSGRSSVALEAYCSARSISAVGMPWSIQSLLEDKIRWHELMLEAEVPVPAGRPVAAGDPLGDVELPAVLQLPSSHSSRGTYIVRSLPELEGRLLESGSGPCLCRALEPGWPLGVSVFIGGGRRLFSAPRLQVNPFSSARDGFLGIQWTGRALLSAGEIAEMEDVLERLSAALIERGFHGLFNVDLLAGPGGVFVLECNPRLSAATPQLALHPELMHGRDLWEQYLAALSDEPLGEDLPSIPDSSFEGAFVDFETYYLAGARPDDESVVESMPSNGTYALRDGSLSFVGPRIDLDPEERRALLYHTARAGAPIGSGPDLGVLITSFPLFSVAGSLIEPAPGAPGLLDALAARVRVGEAGRR